MEDRGSFGVEMGDRGSFGVQMGDREGALGLRRETEIESELWGCDGRQREGYFGG